jgi:hypothetical protein
VTKKQKIAPVAKALSVVFLASMNFGIADATLKKTWNAN